MAFGDIDNQLMQYLQKSLAQFFGSLKNLNNSMTISTKRMNEPNRISRGNESNVFFKLLDEIPANMVLAVTHQALYDEYLGRNIFGYGFNGLGILSTKRFYNAGLSGQKLQELLGKETLKILGLMCGINHCYNYDCIMVKHRYVRDLETNGDVCPSCREKIEKKLKYIQMEFSSK